jgi:nucleoside-diphosphate kinase
MAEKTLIIVKPDAVQRALTGEIINRFERRGFKLVAAKFMKISRETAEMHYSVHQDKPFYEKLCAYLASSPVMVMVWQGQNIIKLSRNMIGATDAAEALPGSIRGDYALTRSFNLVHGSDSVKSAEYEIPLYFDDSEMVNYEKDITPWLIGND